MSLKDLEKAFELVEKNFKKEERGFLQGKSTDFIACAEEILNIIFPVSYKRFITEVGHGGPGSAFIPGIYEEDLKKIMDSGIVWGVLNDRANLIYPCHLISLYDVGDGTTYCLDTSQMNADGECPVVAWPIAGYESTPVLEIVAPDFGKFFLDMVEQEISYKNQKQ